MSEFFALPIFNEGKWIFHASDMIYFVSYRSLQSYIAKDEDICEFLDLLFRPFIDMLENRGLAFGSHFFVSTSVVSSISLVSVRLKITNIKKE